ncbi:hypothetical protein [Lactobacillus hominis]|uniref:Choline binding protein n=1 Tax=Lactobacillus hominis DSM 23910 = CRBIP 24.179 TaxID=1423758 RepID=I7JUJ0_9LACO|nr:hypothetical protein [Lactobacillus hominis]KRM84740.1 choline binding protein [Lactobacillus hominis DSM 23910 = CRBIP 24.179]MCT3347783.1 choline-binding protein [Lactobacillus hominis]CCI81411.1 Choline binding protein [Lactobacillus hominis DSM 23910 = CRBIP 24.179]
MFKFLKRGAIIGSALLGLGGTGVASAAYWTVSSESVSERGRWSSYGSANVKQSNSNSASFNGDVLPNSFGYNVRLINGNAAGRSNYVGLVKDTTTHAGNNTGKRNYYYYADVRSQTYEPHSSYVKLHFSSDYK